MKTLIKKIGAGVLLVSLLASCENGFKSYANDNTARPTLPDVNGRNIGDDGTSDKLIDPFYKGPKRCNRELNHNSREHTALK